MKIFTQIIFISFRKLLFEGNTSILYLQKPNVKMQDFSIFIMFIESPMDYKGCEKNEFIAGSKNWQTLKCMG